jgi:transcription initiation factor TFIIB
VPRKNNPNERERPEQCPACGAEVLNHQETIETWICEKCSYVLDSDEQPSVSDTSILAEEDTNEKTDQIDWESEIAVSGNSEVNLINALSRTGAVADAVGFSDERTLRAGEMTAEAWQTNFMHGRSQERTIGAVVYAVSREVNAALPPAMIAKEMTVSKDEIKQTYQTLTCELELGIGPPVPRDFVETLREELELSPNVESVATNLLQQQAVSGGNPIGIAAAALYVTSDESETNLTLKQLAKVTGLTKETIWRQKEQLVD